MPKRFTGAVSRPEQRRFRVSVPETDESVLTWIGAQSDLSASVRSIIRDAIQRNGYQDATCYPVEQQPRRGRPPKSQAQALSGYEDEPVSTASVVATAEQAGSVVPVAPDAGDGFDSAVALDDEIPVSNEVPEPLSQARSVEAMLGSMRG